MSTDNLPLEDEVRAASGNEEAVRGISGYPGELSCVATRKLDTHDIRVLSNAQNDVGAEVTAGGRGREVVHEKGDGAAVGHVVKVLNNLVVAQKRVVITGGEDQGMAGAGLSSIHAELKGFPSRMRAAAGDQGDARVAALVEDGIPGDADHSRTLRVRKVHSLSVRAVDDNPGNTSIDEADQMALKCRGVNIFGLRVKEGEGGNINAIGETEMKGFRCPHLEGDLLGRGGDGEGSHRRGYKIGRRAI